MVLLVCPTYCREHFLHVLQYTRLELLQVILVLQSYCTDVAVHVIFPLVFSIGQYLHNFLVMHLFLIRFGGLLTVVSDMLTLAVVLVVVVISVSDVLAWMSSLLFGFFLRKSNIEVCLVEAFLVPPVGKIRFRALALSVAFGTCYWYLKSNVCSYNHIS